MNFREILYQKQQIGTVYLFGGSDILPRLVEELQRGLYAVRVYTSPRQAAENVRGEPLLAALTKVCRVPPVVTEDINEVLPASEIQADAIGFGMGEPWPFGKEIRTAFGERLIDYMSVPLPRYRGGAHISWAIMRGERTWGGRLQFITDNTVQGEVDDGEVVYSWDYPVPEWCKIPQQWFDFCGQEDISRIVRFLQQIERGHVFCAYPIDERQSLFLPRLRTYDNGWIDWDQSVEQLVRNFNAFDDPYPGARTCLRDPAYGDREVAIKGVTWNGAYVTPPVRFQRGLVTRIDKAGINIAVINGEILAKHVYFHGADYTAQVKVGMRFHTTSEQLDKALATTPVYTPKAHA
jgi:methionyl-tRNA formyltransferase